MIPILFSNITTPEQRKKEETTEAVNIAGDDIHIEDLRKFRRLAK